MLPRPLAVGLLAALSLLLSERAFADVAAKGLFDIEIVPGAPNATFDGEIRFTPGVQTIFDGASVNMAEDVGTMTFAGDAAIAAERVDFDLTADSDGEFTFDASGTATCDSANCLNERATFAGRLTFIDDPDDVLPNDGIYTFDGTAAVGANGSAENGMFAINAFRATETPAGADVEVTSGPRAFWDTAADTERTFAASALFESVNIAGSTEFIAFSRFPNGRPAGVVTNSMVSVFIEVSTTATFTGSVFVCLAYPDQNDDDVVDDTDVSESRLRVLHAVGAAAFTDVTTGIADGLACGDVSAPGRSLGRLALAVGPAGGVTTTMVGSTTTTSLSPEVTTTTSTVSSTTLPTTSTSVPPDGSTTTTSTTLSGESTTTSTTLPPVTTSTVLGAGTTTTTLPDTATTTSTTLVRRSTTTTVAPSGSTTTTLPVCISALECLGIAIAGPICPGETVNPKLSTLILKKLAKAQTALLAARSADSARKIARLVKKARKQVDKVASKASAFVSKPKGAISAACRDRIFAATALVTQQIDANRI